MRGIPALAAAAAAGLSAGCDGATAVPADGRIEITITADAAAPEAGYILTLDGRDPRLLDRGHSVVYDGLTEGRYVVHLLGLPEECAVRSSNPQVVAVFRGATAAVTFSVLCRTPETGGFLVEVTTEGEPLDDDGYQLSVAGAPLRVIDINAVESYTGLAAGVHLVTLKDVIPECRLEGGNPQPFTVVSGESRPVRLHVICGGTEVP
ncbi:MAG TPA: hypothetical protein VFZ26_02835 [Gemmatimonadales bacterium]